MVLLLWKRYAIYGAVFAAYKEDDFQFTVTMSIGGG